MQIILCVCCHFVDKHKVRKFCSYFDKCQVSRCTSGWKIHNTEAVRFAFLRKCENYSIHSCQQTLLSKRHYFLLLRSIQNVYTIRTCVRQQKKQNRNDDGMNRIANVNLIMRSFSFSATHTHMHIHNNRFRHLWKCFSIMAKRGERTYLIIILAGSWRWWWFSGDYCFCVLCRVACIPYKRIGYFVQLPLLSSSSFYFIVCCCSLSIAAASTCLIALYVPYIRVSIVLHWQDGGVS